MRTLAVFGLIAFSTSCAHGVIDALPQNAKPLGPAQQRSGSWMLKEAKGKDLLYVGDDIGDVFAYSYPRFKLVGELAVPEGAATEGLCVDQRGDVFVPAWIGIRSTTSYVYEYAHGGTEPIATLTDGSYEDTDCSVDPTTGNLAVTNYDGANVAIYQGAQGSPTYYSAPLSPQWVAYDSKGNLFVSGWAYKSKYEYTGLVEMPSGSSDFVNISLNESIGIFALQWNDGYLITAYGTNLGTRVYLYQIQISSDQGTIVGTTVLDIKKKVLYGENGQFLILKDTVLAAGERHGCLQLWRYPQGGKAVKTVTNHFSPWGVVLSIARSGARRHQ